MSPFYNKDIHRFSKDFISQEYLVNKDNPYLIRNRQTDSSAYRHLTSKEIEILVKNNNSAESWDKILVSKNFNPTLVKNCEFWGMVRIGDLKHGFLEYHKLRLPIGISDSTIISCDIGVNCAIRNVHYLSHYILGKQCILFNVDEMITVDNAKFGNGILKEGEDDSVRVWIELANENGNRAVLPFVDMLPADAYIWSRNRADQKLQHRFIEMTDRLCDKQRGYYGIIGDYSVIKNSRTIKNVNFGPHSYIKGTNKLKNLTVQSSKEEPTQIGEGVELVNGIIGYGNRIFYGVKSVRFVTGRNVQLKYAARLINSYLGDNSTISCCEVLNNLIFPFHEQHHNNSFLIASTVEGQANIAAGATIGSNHNSRSPDGEIIAKRGFWPGLNSSFKHNSVFAPFPLIAKGMYYAEINLRIPFTLVSPGNATDEINLYPGYWFKHNMYALARNSWKFAKRDKRVIKEQHIETDYLAPDTVESMLEGLDILQHAINAALGKNLSVSQIIQQQKEIDSSVKVVLTDVLSHGKARVLKPAQGVALFFQMIEYYGGRALIEFLNKTKSDDPPIDNVFHEFPESIGEYIKDWENLGGQIIPKVDVQRLFEEIKIGKINDWKGVHDFYDQEWQVYPQQKNAHAIHSLLKLHGKSFDALDKPFVCEVLQRTKETIGNIVDWAFKSREKDYTNPFRAATYENKEEMVAVLGTIDSNSFLIDLKKTSATMIRQIVAILSRL